MNAQHTTHSAHGFTIKEMSMALLAMVSIAFLVVPMLVASNTFHDAESRRHARLLSSICYQAQQDGIDFVKPGELGGTLQNLLIGGSASNGRRYQAVGMTTEDVQAAAKHLRLLEGNLNYNPEN